MNKNQEPDIIESVIFDSKKEGPLISITAGMHGDEISGVAAVSLAAESIRPKVGKLQFAPVLNPNGYRQKTRFFILNGLETDLNHIMPGKNSTPEQKHARKIYDLIKKSDYHVDIHSARVGQINSPHVRADMSHEPSKKLALSQPFPIIHWPATITTLRGVLNKKDVSAIVVEAGEGLQVQFQEELEVLIKKSLLLKPVSPKPKIFDSHIWVKATQKDSCILQPGDSVKKGQIISKKGVTSPFDGIIIGIYLNPNAKTRLIHLAYNKE